MSKITKEEENKTNLNKISHFKLENDFDKLYDNNKKNNCQKNNHKSNINLINCDENFNKNYKKEKIDNQYKRAGVETDIGIKIKNKKTSLFNFCCGEDAVDAID